MTDRHLVIGIESEVREDPVPVVREEEEEEEEEEHACLSKRLGIVV